MRVGTNKRIGIINVASYPHVLGKIFKIYLMADSNSRRDHCEPIKCLRSPLQELIARIVALELHRHVFLKRVFGTGEVDLDRMVDD
jgi:hypothetical protein